MKCQKCGEREATETFTESTMSFIHGMYQKWCKYCIIKAQLDFAREQAARIPELEEALKLELTTLELEGKDCD